MKRGESRIPLRSIAAKTDANALVRAASVHRPEEAIVVERAEHRPELLAKFLGMRRRRVRIGGRLVLPNLQHGEMVRTVGLLIHVEPNNAGFLPTCLGKLLEERFT